MSQITFIKGPNRYALDTERSRWMNAFRERQGAENMTRFEAAKVSFRDLCNEAAAAPFIADKRLIVVDGVPRGAKGDIEKLQNCLHPSVLLLFILETEDRKNPKLTVAAKELAAAAKVIDCPKLASSQLSAWMDALVGEYGCTLAADARRYLLHFVGQDQALLEKELQKIALYAYGREISVADVELLMATSAEREVWELMDFLGQGNAAGALDYVHKLLDRGYSPQALWNTFLWMVSLLPKVAAMTQEGMSNPWDIARELKTSGPGVKAMLPFARKLDQQALKRIVSLVVEADKGLKTGAYKATTEAPEEILALIDRSILAFA